MAQQTSDVVERESATSHQAETEAVKVEEGVVEETLIEEVSIDGMCGVY